MVDAYIFDHVRTPRGRGRANGGLHAVPSVELAAQVLRAVQRRNQLDTREVEEVGFGIVTPFGEQGSNLTRPAILMAGYDQTVPGFHVDRACSSGLDAINLVAGQVMAGQAPAWLLVAGSSPCPECRWALRAAHGHVTRQWLMALTLRLKA